MKLMKRLAGGAAVSLLAMAAAGAVYAQETTSAVRGEVLGPDGKPVVGASVTVVHTPSGTRATAVTNEEGVFDARNLRVGGPYTITASGGGLESKSIEGVMLTVGETERVTIDYAAAALTEVAVTASRVGERETGPKTVLGREAVASVASVTRDIRDLARRDI
ncbi:MAG: carboxypeptidase regulatory-like domain-containing protein, partial [Brevundimonas sp.]